MPFWGGPMTFWEGQMPFWGGPNDVLEGQMTFWEGPNCRKKSILSMQRHRHVKILNRLEGAKFMASKPFLEGVMAPLPPWDPPLFVLTTVRLFTNTATPELVSPNYQG